MTDLKLLVMSRKYIRSQVTRQFNERDKFSEYNSSQKFNLVEKLKNFKEELKGFDSNIISLKWSENQDENEIEIEFSSCQEYKDKISEMLLLLEVDVNRGTSGNLSESPRSLLKSPVAPLPNFKSSDNENLELFLQQFEETTGKFSYTDYDRLLLLKQQVSGKALLLIDSLEADKQGYSHAKELLKTAFASVPTQKFNVMKQISELKLGYDSEPFQYISNIRKIQEAVKTLKVDIDDVLQYFFLRGMNETFKNQLIQITNNSKPTTKEIVDNFFEANERYQNANNLGKLDKTKLPSHDKLQDKQVSKSSNLAAKVNIESSNPFTSCTLCSDKVNGDHPIHKCPNFTTAKEKIARLSILNGCTRCARIEHLDTSCHFRFARKCKYCQGWHFSFLCLSDNHESSAKVRDLSKTKAVPSNKQIEKGKSKDAQNSTQNGVVCPGSSFQSNGGIDSILPTFSCTLGHSRIRGLKDSGSQANYISDCALEGQCFKVVKDNFDLVVNGFNGAKCYHTKIVQISVKIGETVHNIEAICVPAIDINLNLPGLGKVVKSFRNYGYKLLDEFLDEGREDISNIQFILGANSSHCLMEKMVSLGHSGQSVYYETDFGIMLIGNIEKLISNLKFLPSLRDDTHLFLGLKENLDEQGKSLDNIKFPMTSCFKSSVRCIGSADPEICILDHDGLINEHKLQEATDYILERECSYYLHKDSTDLDGASTELNKKLVRYLLNNTQRDEEGRLVMPLLWNGRVSHLLGKNTNLAKQILKSNLKKLSNNDEFLRLMDENIKTQAAQNLIERIDNLDKFCEEHPEYSFLPHMGIFKLDRSTTKCRIVFLSNLCEKQRNGSFSISHNQAMLAGPCINQKLSTALLLLRFDLHLLCFDLKKAFQQIALNETDQSKLLFFWFKNVSKGDFTIVAYRNLRLSFGLRCSPTILMIGLYKILMLDTEGDLDNVKEFKKLIYSLMYMDNGAFTANDSESLHWGFDNLNSIFNPYKFELQQFVTNDVMLQEKIDMNLNEVTPEVVKLFGLKWNRVTDCISSPKLELDCKANTKRLILKSIASNFDPYNFNGPILNRARLFMHELQLNTSLGWDSELPAEQQREWSNIAKQVNMTPQIEIPRFVGERHGSYRLIAFTDSSKIIYGTTIFIQCIKTKKISFILAKNRLVNKQLESKSIPSLEFQGIVLGTEILLDLNKDLAGPQCPKPIRIVESVLYTDSIVSLSWINSYVNKLDKMNKRSVFIMNRLDHIQKICENNPVRFCFVSGILNPADCITRPMSYKQLLKTNYFTGPEFLRSERDELISKADTFDIVVPNPKVNTLNGNSFSVSYKLSESRVLAESIPEHLVLLDKCSSFSKLVRIHKYVLKFIVLLRRKVNLVSFDFGDAASFHLEATRHIIRKDQRIWYGEVFQYLENCNNRVKDIPNIIAQLNAYVDDHGLLRIRSKMPNWRNDTFVNFPILLHKHSKLTELVIKDFHEKFSHAGVYSLLSEMRKKFWIPHYFSVVKKVLKDCVICKRFKERTVKVNQSTYRDFRIDPPSIPFRYIFIDHFGPYNVKLNGEKCKVWILCLTCHWSRAINLKICLDLTTKEFLRALQLHSYQYGIPQLVLSDLGSQLVAGANVVTNFLGDPETQAYFEENGVKSIKFQQYPKGCNKLGGLVETCVKMSKRLIHGALKNNVLDFRDFEFFIEQTVHLVNRRPIAFKEGLRDSITDEVPDAITPEILIHGHELLSINIIPDLQGNPDEDLNWTGDNNVSKVLDKYQKLRKVRSRLINIYNSEFIAHLVVQATDERSRYKPVTHKRIQVGDIVLLKEPHLKPSNYPMGIVKKVTINDLDEVTDIAVFKGASRETVRRHVTSVIPLLSPQTNESEKEAESKENRSTHQRKKRKAAVISEARTKDMLGN